MKSSKWIYLSSIAALALSSCNEKESQQAAQQEVQRAVKAEAVNFSPELTKVASHLDTNGVHFSVTHIDQDVNNIAKIIDELLDTVRKNGEDIPKELSIKTIVHELGINKVSAIGKSSRKTADGWHNRFYLDTGGSQKGLLSLMGKEPKPWRAATLAPDDSDLVIEFDLNLSSLQKTLKPLAEAFGVEAEKELDEMMNQKVSRALTIADLLGKADFHTTIIAAINPNEPWKATRELELPNIDAAICIDEGLWFWEQFGEMITKNAKVTEEDGVTFVRSPESIPTPLGKISPLFIIDAKKNEVWLGMREAYVKRCRSGASPLGASANFKKATTGFPDKGNALAYISNKICQETAKTISKLQKKAPHGSEKSVALSLVKSVLEQTLTQSSCGYAWGLSKTNQGILILSNSPVPDKGGSISSSIVPIATMASMATPVIIKQKKKAELVSSISNMRQLFLLLFEYDQDEGKLPDDLTALVKEGYVTQNGFNQLISYKSGGKKIKLVYISGYKTSDNTSTIIMHTAEPIDGKRAALHLDGSVKTMRESQFQKLITKQQR